MSRSDDEVLGRLAALEDALGHLRARLDRLEGRAAASPPPPAPVEAPRPSSTAGEESLVTLAGVMLVALAGAYLVRALTDGGTLSAMTGVGLGLVYASAFLLGAGRAAAARRPLAASTHAMTAALIAYPLLWETTVRFGLLAPPVALALLVAVVSLALWIAQRHGLVLLAWVHVGAGLVSSLGFLVATRHLAAVTLALLALATFVEALGPRLPSAALRWPVAGALDLGVLVLAWLAGRAQGLPEGYPPVSTARAALLTLSPALLYLASLAGATLRGRRALTLLETAQLAVALVLGLEGASHVLEARGASTAPVALSALGLGLAAYVLAFAFVERREGRGSNFYVYSTGGALLLFIGTIRVLAPGPRVVVWSTLAIVAAALGRRFGRNTLRYHALAYLAGACLAGGLLRLAVAGLFAPAPVALSALAGVAWTAGLATYALIAGGGQGKGWELPPRLSAALLVVCAVPGGVAAALARPLGGHPSLLMGLRTAALAALALALAALGRAGRPEARWLAYAALAAGAFKLVVQDLPAGQAAELFSSFLLLGGAAVLTSRLLAGQRP